MKKLYSLALLLVMLVVTGFSASAVTATFKWEIPGSVVIRVGSATADPIELPANATSYVADSGDAMTVYVYVGAADGYIVTDAVADTGRQFYKGYGAAATMFSCTINSSLDGATVNVTAMKLERNDKFTFDVVNGANRITEATFQSSGLTLDLSKGVNTINFNPDIDKDLFVKVTIPGSKGTSASDPGEKCYSFTNNGAEVNGTKSWFYEYTTYKIPALTADAKLVLQVYEVEPTPEMYTVTLELPTGFENCVYSVRNWSESTWIDLENGQFKVEEGTDLSVNFSTDTDYEYSKFLVNGVETTPNNNSIRFKVTQNTTIKVEGSIKQYAQLPVTYYIQNPAGIKLNLMDGSDTSADLTGGTAVTEDITVSSINGTFTLKASETKKFDITVSEKKPMIEVECQEGYYVAAVIANEDGKNSFITSWVNVAELNSKVVYVQAIPTTDKYSYKTDIVGDPSYVTIKTANETIAGQWGNNYYRVKPTAAQQTFDFVVGFDNPFSVGVAADEEAVAQVFVDGKESPADDTGVAFGFVPYVPADADALQAVSTLTVYVDGGATTTGASLKTEGDATAQFLGGETLWTAEPAGQPVLKGTKLTVVPASKDYVITYRGEVVNGLDITTGEVVNGLNEAGQYVFTPVGSPSANVVVVSPAPSYTAIKSISPADKTELRTLESFSVTLPVVDETFETMFYPTETLAEAVILDAEGNTVAKFAELGEVYGTDEGETVVPFTTTPAITKEGKYTLVIPANAFAQSGWSDEDEAFAPVPGAVYTSALSAAYTVNPKAVTIFDKYEITPVFDESTESLVEATLAFTSIPYGTNVGYGFKPATIAIGTEKYVADIEYDYGGECLQFSLKFYTFPNYEAYNKGEVAELHEIMLGDGTWTLTIPAGTFVLGYQENPEIVAEIQVGKSGIGSIFGDENTAVNVYSIDGRAVITNGTADQLNGLDNGLYIINGKKVSIRK